MTNDTRDQFLQDLSDAYERLPTCSAHPKYDYGCRYCVDAKAAQARTCDKHPEFDTHCGTCWEALPLEEFEKLMNPDFVRDHYETLPDTPDQLLAAATSPDRIRGTGEVTVYPTILETPNGVPIIFEKMLHWISSRPGRGKSWLGLMAAEKVLERGGRVAVIDYDAPPPESWGERSRTLGGDVLLDNLTDQRAALHFLGAVAPATRALLADWLTAAPANLVILDTTTAGGMAIDGANVEPWIREHVETFRQAGVTIILFDHLNKSAEARANSGPSGSHSKLDMATIPLRITGTLEQMWNPKTQKDGQCWIEAEKDKLGRLPMGGPYATLKGSFREGAFALEIADVTKTDRNPQEAKAVDLRVAVENAIYDTLEDQPPMSFSALKKEARLLTRFANSTFANSLREMTDGGLITKDESGRWATYTVTKTTGPSGPGLVPDRSLSLVR